ncbi:Arginine:agmatine antiporter [Candidatus Bealeia paramacronuclearis]|uniref:Arginine/agmatine antiporter n=1 Tax=Candidatus Bealeia paramacronuclearis TaxID=1921001 RepID=A0ABZ2C6B2_9PROT|nr:Arginine:agmatine antiporter [Candidatus Bealeia paramacronuclearis]
MKKGYTNDKVGLWPVVSLVTGNLVGSGVYLLPATLAVYGTISLFGWIITSIGAILLSLVFAQLSARIPKTGGPYLYAREAFGNTVGYYVCWGYWMLSWISNPTLAIAAVGYVSVLSGGLSPAVHFLLELGIVGGFTLFNLFGLRVTGWVELWITVLKIVPLLLLPLIGLFYIEPTHFADLNSSGLPLGTALNSVAFLTLWAFVGLETGTVPAGQVLNASKTVPRATVIGTLIATAVYVLGTVAIMGIVPPHDLVNSKAPYADAAQLIFGGSWGTPIAIAAIITCLGTLNGWLIVVGRIPYGAAHDGVFPEIFKKTTKHGTPYWGVVISSICTLPLLLMSLENTLLEQFQFIVDMAVTLILLVYTVSVLAYFKLLFRDGKYSITQILIGVGALAFSIWALWAASLKMVLFSLALLICGIPMHLWMKRKARPRR